MTYANLQVVDYTPAGRPCSHDATVLAAPLSIVLTQELEGASAALGVSIDDLLVAALARAIARTIGEGTIQLDTMELDASGRARAVNSMPLACLGPELADATGMLARVRRAAVASSLQRIVHGADDALLKPAAEILFTHGVDPAGLGHPLELHAYRRGDVLALDWRFDARSFEPYTVQELSEQLPYTLIELTSEATDPAHAGEMAMAH